jgi:ABC-type multidrug transport system fused ATPase/permease subunit
VDFVVFTGIIGGAIASLGTFYTELVSAMGATDRILDILEQPSELDLKEAAQQETPGRFRGEIVFKGLRFTYPSRPDVPVLKGIDLHIQPGQQVALVGASGAGKTTIMQLLLRFYQPESGEILVDGRPAHAYGIREYRSNLAVVPQEVLLFGGTIRENIQYGRQDATEEEVVEAARKANAWEFIASFPDGLDTLVGERGIKLSGGQRQRIAIARAILKDPAILLLDEATSSLDAESERLVQEALNVLLKGRTSIIIAHRLATVRDVDCIYVLEGGRILEQGTHEELTRKENGAYNTLAKLQFEI